jgi:hypothetical protein
MSVNLRYSNSGGSTPSQRWCYLAVASSAIGSPHWSDTFCISECPPSLGGVSTDLYNGSEILPLQDVTVQRRILTLLDLVYVPVFVLSAVSLGEPSYYSHLIRPERAAPQP